ncbi:MAG: hypothetical protein DMG13_24030 [Acidobacteria bacterium]|nr:MAG: hypothetical protein DMG13_24030 [Acidobacteriota bacterium]
MTEDSNPALKIPSFGVHGRSSGAQNTTAPKTGKPSKSSNLGWESATDRGHRRRLGRKTELGKHPKSIQLSLVQ